jgi:hypothetical protein
VDWTLAERDIPTVDTMNQQVALPDSRR